MTKEEFFEKALEACDRKTLDEKEQNCFSLVAEFWDFYIHKMPCPFIQDIDVAMLMVLFKVARVLHGYQIEDSLVDIAGYASCANDLYEKRKAVLDDYDND